MAAVVAVDKTSHLLVKLQVNQRQAQMGMPVLVTVAAVLIVATAVHMRRGWQYTAQAYFALALQSEVIAKFDLS